MKVLADTSIWIDYFRGRDAALCTRLDALIDEDALLIAIPIRVELLAGVRKNEIDKLQRVLSALPTVFPERETWTLMEKSAQTAAAKNQRFGFADLLIAALAHVNGCMLWSKDADFARMSKLAFISIYKTPAY